MFRRLHVPFAGRVVWKCISMLHEGDLAKLIAVNLPRGGERTAQFVSLHFKGCVDPKWDDLSGSRQRNLHTISPTVRKQKVWMKTLVIADAPSPNHPVRCSRFGGWNKLTLRSL